MERQLIHLNEQGESMNNIEQLKESFDSIINKIDENKTSLSDVTFIKEIVELVIHSNEKYFSNSTILDHRIFIILRDYYLNILQRWRYGEKLDEISCSIFETISNLFLKISNHTNETNLYLIKELIFHETLLHEINRFLDELSTNKKYLDDPQIKGIDNFLRTIQRFERTRSDDRNDHLFDNIVKCICSSTFIEIFLQSVNQENENPGQKFLLNTCTDYIYSHSIDNKHKQSLIDIRRSLLPPFTQWIIQQSSTFRLWTNKILIIFRQILFLLTLSIQINRDLNIDKYIYDYYSKLIDSFINILYSINQTDHNKISQSLIGTIIPNLYTMTLSNQLEKYLQNKHITSLILKIIHYENDEIQLNAFKILSAITIEQDTKNNSFSNNIVKSFILFIHQIIDQSNQTLRFYDLLKSFKNLIQYDQIKDEFVKENGLSLILRCATDNKFKFHQIQQPALEILFSLTFNKQAYQQLRSNLNEMKSILCSYQQTIPHTLQYILWKLEKEEEELNRPINYLNNFQYDVYLSYSQLDKDFCIRLYDRLIKDDFRVFIDTDETIGITMDEISRIIDNSEYFLMLISDSYKQNLYCRCQSTYAYERQCQIIPLIVTSNYRPDGWLNRVVTGKSSIDLTKLDFEIAYTKLKNDMDRQKKFIKILPKKDSIQIEYPIKSEHPCEIDQWTSEDVKLFLKSKDLDILLPILCEMNGNLLHDLYLMCLSNRESMYHTLRNELLALNSSNQQQLTLLIYLRFLNEIQKYIPSFVINQK